MTYQIKNNNAKVAYEKGYRVINGAVHSPKNKVLKLNSCGTNNYLRFTIVYSKKKRVKVFVHRLVAYQKFGEQMFELNICVRHLDGNVLNNLEHNITLGTRSDNMMDRSAEDRKLHSLRAASFNRKFTNTEVAHIRNRYEEARSYKKIMLEFNITSKGTLHYILNHNYQT